MLLLPSSFWLHLRTNSRLSLGNSALMGWLDFRVRLLVLVIDNGPATTTGMLSFGTYFHPCFILLAFDGL